jgi:hypothetical protein
LRRHFRHNNSPRPRARTPDDHNGIFTQPLLRFLIPYIALIETKLVLNSTEDVEMKQRALAT